MFALGEEGMEFRGRAKDTGIARIAWWSLVPFFSLSDTEAEEVL